MENMQRKQGCNMWRKWKKSGLPSANKENDIVAKPESWTSKIEDRNTKHKNKDNDFSSRDLEKGMVIPKSLPMFILTMQLIQ